MLAGRLGRERSAQPPQLHRQQEERGQLGGEGLGGGHPDLRAGVGVERALALARNGRTQHVADGEGPGAPLLRLLHRRQRVGGLARLGDGEHERLLPDHRIPVAELAGQLHVHRQPSELLDHEPAGEPGVPARAAGHHHQPVDLLHPGRVEVHAVEDHVPFLERDPPADGVGHRPGLLEDLLVHEVLVPVLLGGHRAPLDLAGLPGHRAPLDVLDGDALRRQDRQLALLEDSSPFVCVRGWPGRRRRGSSPPRRRPTTSGLAFLAATMVRGALSDTTAMA